MTGPDQLRRLHFINALFAGLTGQDLYLAQQIASAITASLDAAPDDPAFGAAAARLLDRLCGGRQDHGFFHWNAAESAVAATPLFIRETMLAGLRGLARFSEATVLVTNLRRAHCTTSGRWTRRREQEYRESLALIEGLAVQRRRQSASLNLLFI